MNNTAIAKTRTGTMRWDEDSLILFVEIDDGAQETLEDAMNNSKLGAELTQNKPFGMLLDITGIGSIDADARNFYSTNTNTRSLGVAMITNSVISRVVGNFFIGLNKPQMPLRLFTQDLKATEWLNQLITDHPPQ